MKNGKIAKIFPSLIYLSIPNLLTVITIVLNILIIYFYLSGFGSRVFWLYSIVIGIDVFDGKIAKLLNKTSDFGARLDSLCDAVSFCVMPAVIAVFLGFNSAPAVILMIINAIAGIWRLAYFDIVGITKEGTQEYYVGTPTTRTAAIFFIGLAIMGFFKDYLNVFFYAFFIISPVLMLINTKIAKLGLFAKVLYVVMPLTVILFFFVW